MKKAMRFALANDDRYKPKNEKPDMYESAWGTPNSKATRICKSITIAKHPVMTWILDIKAIVARKGHTEDERLAVLTMVSQIDEMGDFHGVRTFNLEIPSDGMRFQATIIRITDQQST